MPKKAPPIPLVTDATADLPAPIFLIAASPIVIRQGYFKRLRLIYLFPYRLRPCILILSSNVLTRVLSLTLSPTVAGRRGRHMHILIQIYGSRSTLT